jgi:hypothetical protein
MISGGPSMLRPTRKSLTERNSHHSSSSNVPSVCKELIFYHRHTFLVLTIFYKNQDPLVFPLAKQKGFPAFAILCNFEQSFNVASDIYIWFSWKQGFSV